MHCALRSTRKVLSLGEAALFWAQFESDRVSGRLKVHVCNLADVIIEAKRFLTFDANQKKLALTEGLEVPT